MDNFLGRNDSQMQCRGVLHIVEDGDTLYKISKKYGVPLSRVMYANPYVDVYNLQAGDEICVPVMTPRPFMEKEPMREMRGEINGNRMETMRGPMDESRTDGMEEVRNANRMEDTRRVMDRNQVEDTKGVMDRNRMENVREPVNGNRMETMREPMEDMGRTMDGNRMEDMRRTMDGGRMEDVRRPMDESRMEDVRRPMDESRMEDMGRTMGHDSTEENRMENIRSDSEQPMLGMCPAQMYCRKPEVMPWENTGVSEEMLEDYLSKIPAQEN